MVEITDAQIIAAQRRGTEAQHTEPRAISARYDPKLKRVIVELLNGCAFAFPPHLAQGLETATDEQLAKVKILGAGFGLRWEALDVDLSVPGLLNGIFGTSRWMAANAGRTTSEAKAAAARANGARGGRPRKAAS